MSRPLSLALALTLAAAPLAPQERPHEETAEVVEVEVPVNVVRRDGDPLRGLKLEDFEVLDEGRPQTLTGLRVVDLAVSEPQAGLERGLPSTSRRHFLLLFDLSFSNPASTLKARLAARDFVLRSLHPTDLAAVATYSLETGPRLVVTFTPDRAQLARALDTLGFERATYHHQEIDPLKFIIADVGQASGVSSDTTLGQARAGFEQEMIEHLNIVAKGLEKSRKTYDRSRISAWTRALGATAKALNAVRGRKQIIYFSEGFDSRLMLGRQASETEEMAEDQLNLQRGDYHLVDSEDLYGNVGLQRDVEVMLEEFRRADCVIQAVDIGGLRADADIRETTRDVGQDSLFVMADGTGGRLFEDANDLGKQLGQVLERSNVTYVLAFQPDRLKHDGAYHRLKVRVKRDLPRGTQVAHRSGYYAPRPYQELDPLERNLLASDAIASAAPRQDIGVNVLAAPFRAADSAAYLPVIVEVDGRSLLAGHTGDELQAEIYAYVTNAAGEMRDFFAQRLDVDLKRARAAMERTGLKYYGHLELPPGDYLVRVLVRNGVTGRAGVQSVAVEVPKYDSREPMLLPPFFIESPGTWVLVREKAGEAAGQASVVYPFTVKGEPYIPAARPSLGPDGASRICLVGYNLAAGELRLDARVTAPDGREVEGGKLILVERTVTGLEGVDKLLASFAPERLAAGSYRLQVALTSPGGQRIEAGALPFTVAR